jgi:hypothetical protein
MVFKKHERDECLEIFVGNLDGKTSRKPGRKWKDNEKINLGQIEYDWIYMVQERDQWWILVTTVIKLCVPKR